MDEPVKRILLHRTYKSIISLYLVSAHNSCTGVCTGHCNWPTIWSNFHRELAIEIVYMLHIAAFKYVLCVSTVVQSMVTSLMCSYLSQFIFGTFYIWYVNFGRNKHLFTKEISHFFIFFKWKQISMNGVLIECSYVMNRTTIMLWGVLCNGLIFSPSHHAWIMFCYHSNRCWLFH